MTANELRRQYIDFFVKKYGHAEIKSSSVVPENDPTVLFTTAGMHPLVPYLMGEKHPAGTRLVDVQKCVRTDDIDEVGDDTHCTFFEMLGNWSLGDYFKGEAIKMSFEFLTLPVLEGGLGLNPKRLLVTCFAGDKDAPRDNEAAEEWIKYGFQPADQVALENGKPVDSARQMVFFYGKKQNWWGPAGQTGPCGPDTEIYYDVCPELPWYEHKPGFPKEALKKGYFEGINTCHPDCDCKRYVEIWNNVFMQYNKQADGSYITLKQQNVDTGMGLDRTLAIFQGKDSHYNTELFEPIMHKITELSKPEAGLNGNDLKVSSRIIADHVRAATFIMGDPWGVVPSNVDQGYIVRRLIRRAIRHGRKLGINDNFTAAIAELVCDIYGPVYDELINRRDHVLEQFSLEEEKFQKTLEHGLKELKKIWNPEKVALDKVITEGDQAFFIYETYGFPIEMIEEELAREGYKLDKVAFSKAFKEAEEKHAADSRAGSTQKFAGGLADHSDEVRKLHTATHLLHKALKIVLGEDVNQKGSNITAERLRFDFNYPQKMTPEQLKQVEDIVNEQIKNALPISYEITTVEEAKKYGAVGLFEHKYGDQIKCYKMGDFSMEICGGPHADNTSDLKSFKIIKEEASSAGVRRIKAVIGK